MTERDVPFLQEGNYTAAEVRRIMSALTGARDFVDLAPSTSPLVSAGGGHGVIGAGDMAVTGDGAGMDVTVAAGLALVRGTQQSDQGVYVTSNDAPKTLTVSAADATNPRKDLIVTRVKDNEYGIAGNTGPLEVIAGTPTGGLTANNVTGRPTPPENALVLAEVFIPAGVTSNASFTITDLRTFAAALGGVRRGPSTQRTAATGMGAGEQWFETDTGLTYLYDGSAWTGNAQARVFNSAAIVVATSMVTILTFNSERYDVNATHDVSTNSNRLTVPAGQGGLYAMGAHVDWQMSSAGYRTLGIRLNGTTLLAGTTFIPGVANIPAYQSVQTEYRLAAGDYIETRVFHTNGADLNIQASPNYGPEFWFRRVAP